MGNFRALQILLAILLAVAVVADLAAQGKTLSVADFKKNGSPTTGIQEAVDALGPQGGTVFIPAGVYEICRSVTLRSGVQLKGEGEHSVIARRDPVFQTVIAQPALTGQTQVSVQDASRFKAGSEVTVFSDSSYGWWCTHTVVTRIEGNTLHLDRELTHDYLPEAGGAVANTFPALYATEQARIRIEDLVIDGRLEESEGLNNDFTVSAIHFREVSDSYVIRVHVLRYPGDGVSAQMGDNVTVVECLSERNLGHGFHPGTGVTSGSWTNNVGRFNGWDGLYFCHRVRHTTVSGNRFHDNGWNGTVCARPLLESLSSPPVLVAATT